MKTLAQLERAFQAARRNENRAIDALGDKPTKAQTDRCWALASKTNAARLELSAARDAVVEFDTTVYRRNHGAEPRGRGSWGFVMGAADYDVVDQRDAAGRALVWFAPGSSTFAEAKKLARVEAMSRGVTFVGVAS